MKTPRHLAIALHLLLALLLACGWDSFSNGEEPADTAKENTKDTLKGKRICVKQGWGGRSPYVPLQLGEEEYEVKLFQSLFRSEVYQPFGLSCPECPSVCAKYKPPKTLFDLLRSAILYITICDAQRGKEERSSLFIYRALVSPEVTYENTVWGKLRKRGDSTYYAWHVVGEKKLFGAFPWDRPPPHNTLSEWDPNRPVVWPPDAKEAHDELAKHVSLSLPLTEEWDAYDLKFVPTVGRPPQVEDGRLPEHVRQSLVPGHCDAVLIPGGPGHYTAATSCPDSDYLGFGDGSAKPTLCFMLRRR